MPWKRAAKLNASPPQRRPPMLLAQNWGAAQNQELHSSQKLLQKEFENILLCSRHEPLQEIIFSRFCNANSLSGNCFQIILVMYLNFSGSYFKKTYTYVRWIQETLYCRTPETSFGRNFQGNDSGFGPKSQLQTKVGVTDKRSDLQPDRFPES